MDTPGIIGRIDELVAEERELRGRASGDPGLGADGAARLKALEVQLDQCWDLLRQRRAKSEFGENPDEAAVRPPGEVEGYLS
ncbi:DUF2630 family protein [Streptomyces sp. NPDC048442]|uniref:DUF2630 family protein n=1 Tax=Streptomyces sp. NPDC048442 TaxID=3154823 RepID=UPI0034205EF9